MDKNILNTYQINQLLSFVGYGNPGGDTWFINFEETGEGVSQLHERLQLQRVEDLSEAYRKLNITQYHQERPVLHPLLEAMSQIILALENRPITRENLQDYQKGHLGRKQGRTFLLYLMPIPVNEPGGWNHTAAIPQFASRDDYIELLQERRIRYLKTYLFQYHPTTVVCFGNPYWEVFKQLFSNLTFYKTPHFEYKLEENRMIMLAPGLLSITKERLWSTLTDLIHSRGSTT